MRHQIKTLFAALNSFDIKMYIFGENHFSEDVSIIRNKICRISPKFILHELADEDKEFYAKNLPNTKLIKIDIKTVDNLPLKDKFEIREKHMLKIIKNYYGSEITCVVVGDTHLRTIETTELGEISPISLWAKKKNIKVIRSKSGEIM